MPNVLTISGSPTHPSRTYGLAEYANSLLQQQGFHTDTISVRDFSQEALVYGQYNSPALEPVNALLSQAHGIIIATPIYKASYTGLLKSFFDLLPQRAFEGKVVLPIATGGTIAHLLAVDYALKPVLFELKARHILGGVYAVDKQLQLQADQTVQVDEETDQRLKHSLNDFVEAINLRQGLSNGKAFAEVSH
ncbi:NADPH-dependent FMN reductase [Leptolyngbya sp. FACHB-711]|uniref:NADPH-dependent FMN reductase n=1 Tax=unclassified Leptolyngbya TaxID=2650499 RepID=UPI0016899B30|nr:NADPH-dependent FMN reductase [Leptolyngbya sp. FACHB-711]MBD1853264.1 NADPH-dependent FMN reductase [Cyanobacteria bacterium FACHB-502]MBD2024302.1 NADPH-dependent FMN reductase [Leptolyngbya sp. FACHB-711]